MKISHLIRQMEDCEARHGDVCISVRHTTSHEFAPNDDMTNIKAAYDGESNLFVISVEN